MQKELMNSFDKSFKEKLILKINKNCSLRILNPSDVSQDYISWMNDYEVVKFTEQSEILHSKSSIKKFVKEKLDSKSELLFGIFYKEKHIGNIKLGPIKWNDLTSDISYIIGIKELWGKGIATSSINAVSNFSNKSLNLKKLYAGYYENNFGSARALEKCGFTIDYIKKKDILFEGLRKDRIRVSLTLL